MNKAIIVKRCYSWSLNIDRPGREDPRKEAGRSACS